MDRVHVLFRNDDVSGLFWAEEACQAEPQFFFAVILPPLGVLLEKGCGCDLLINILLTCLGYIPGIIHAFYIILKY